MLRSPNDLDYYRPESPAEFADLDFTSDGRPVRVRVSLSGDVFAKTVQYPIIVEAWEKKKVGRHKRRWEAEFTQAERNKIASYHGRFYRWYLVTGTPRRIQIQPKTIELLQRAVNFFAEC